MDNLIEKYNDSELMFLEDQHEGLKTLVVKSDWFSWMPLSETYDNYGQSVPAQHLDECEEDEEGNRENCECEEYKVQAYNFFDGSNWKTIAINSDFMGTDDCRFVEVTDEAKIAAYLEALKNAEFYHETTGRQEYRANGLSLTRSQWQGDFELYDIRETES